ncbi:MAG TPA: hypothetical protein VEU30_12145 [Thermoanaerobaculia bacterium]|nr:hypothetical protein [Thermoanaerobaculia bacterium]
MLAKPSHCDTERRRSSYGNRVPQDEPVISPGAMFDSEQLIEVTRR